MNTSLRYRNFITWWKGILLRQQFRYAELKVEIERNKQENLISRDTRYDKATETFLKTYLLNILWHIKINNNDSIKSLERLLLAGAGDKTAGLSIARENIPFIILRFLQVFSPLHKDVA